MDRPQVKKEFDSTAATPESLPWRAIPRSLAAVTAALAAITLLGWALNLAELRSVLPGAVQMKANTALALLACSLALFLRTTRPSSRLQLCGQMLGLLVAALGIATLLEYLLGRDAGIDQIIFRDTGHAYNVVRGRMSPYSALAFIGIGLALTLPRRSALRPVLYFGVLLSSLIGGASLLGYFWTAKELTTDVWLPPVALNTALAFLMLSIGTAIALRIPALHGLGAAGRQRVENKVLIAFVGALLLLCAGGGITYRMQVSFANSAQLVSDAQQVRTTLGELYGLIADAESEQRDYLLIGGAAYLSEYQRLSAQLGLRMQALRLLYAKDTPQPQAMDRLVGLIQRYQQTLGRELDLAATSDRDALRAAIAGDGTVEQMQGIRRSIKQLDAAEEDLLVTRARRLSLGRSYTLIALLATLTLSATILFVLFGSIIRDIRERARITAELDKARSEAQRAALAKSEFLAAMSHEIRTPMNGILGMLELLQQSSLMGRQLEMVQLTRESADSLLTIIDDILDFSKIEAGRLEIERSPIAVAEVVERSCALLDRVAERKQTTLTAFCDPAVPARLLGDSTRLRQILVNLINNAIKFSSGLERPGRVRVRVQLIERRADSALVEFLVSDNGIGMDEATLARLFGSFMQADVSTTRRYGGTGLGLAICKRLVDLMGGEIAVQSAADKGARFSVRLPLPIAPGAAPEPQQAQELSLLPCLVLGGEHGVADDLAAYLRADGAGVTRAADEKSIAPWAQAQPPGVAVCVIEAGEQLPRLAELRAGMQSRADLSVRTVCVVIGRALRNPRAETEGFVVLDGNALARRTLTEAVAIAAGRATRSAAPAPPLRHGAPRTAPERQEAIRQGRLILVAEDHEINQRVICEQLSLLGYAADIARNGREALERWRTGQYGLILADLHMPEMDGYALTLQIRLEERDRSRTPIIALTANALQGEAERCRSIGMDDYLTKPASLASLTALMSRWLPAPAPTATGPAADVVPTQTAGTRAAAPALDVSVLESLIGDDPALIADFLEDFASSAAQLTRELIESQRRGPGQAASIAHKLKSSARAAGALKLGELCAAIEEADRAGQQALLPRLIEAVQTEMSAVQRQLLARQHTPSARYA